MGQTRAQLSEFRHLISEDIQDPYYSLLVQIASRICLTDEVPSDLTALSSLKLLNTVIGGFSNLLRGNQKKSNPKFDTYVLFVIGGITFQEIAEVTQLFENYGKHVLVGSTNISTRDEIRSQLLKTK
jgi:hypothetical protein